MSSSASIDRLEAILAKVKTWSIERQIQFFYGFIENEKRIDLPIVLLNEEGENTLDTFLTALDRLASKVLFCNITRLDQEQWKAAIEDRRTVGHNQRGEIVKNCENKIGHIASIEFRGLVESPRMLIKYDEFSEWFPTIYESEEWDSEYVEDDPEIDNLARQLASNSSFQRAKNRHQREYVAKKLLAGHAKANSRLDLMEIAREASAIYETELKPQIENQLLNEVTTLREQGLKVDEIAMKLALRAEKVRSLLRGS